ncbi:hypothetical protein Droror1_Dr00003255 [Drosera rotundifolia]
MNNNMERMPMPSSSSLSSPQPPFHRRMMMHMAFYWRKEALILFPKWPGDSSLMYYIALVFVFLLAVLLEWMSHSRLVKNDMNDSVRRAVVAGMHGVRMGLAYLVMLAVMSFNGGVFVAAVGGHVIGLFVFGRMQKEGGEKSAPDLPPMSC